MIGSAPVCKPVQSVMGEGDGAPAQRSQELADVRAPQPVDDAIRTGGFKNPLL